MRTFRVALKNPVDGSITTEEVKASGLKEILYSERVQALVETAGFSLTVEPVPHGNSRMVGQKRVSRRRRAFSMSGDKQWEGRVRCHFSTKTCPVCVKESWTRGQCDDHIVEVHKMDDIQTEAARGRLKAWLSGTDAKATMARIRSAGHEPRFCIRTLKSMWKALPTWAEPQSAGIEKAPATPSDATLAGG
jgi:hypothetical protein